MQYDIIILGLGGIGSAVADWFSRKGHSVLGLEQFEAVHDLGSSHGETRCIRKAYFEDPAYVPLVLRAYELWDELEDYAGEKLLEKCGCLIMGKSSSSVIQGCLKSAHLASLKYQMLDSTAISRQYGFKIPPEVGGFFEPDGGYLYVEKCIHYLQKRAQQYGATLRFNCPVKSWQAREHNVEIICQDATYRGKKLIICAGAWSKSLLGNDSPPLAPKRVLQFWFHSPKKTRHPVFFKDIPSGHFLYGFPRIKEKIKVAFHNIYQDCLPDKINRSISKDEVLQIQQYIKPLIPNLGDYSHAKTCLYTMAPDEHFILGNLNNIFLATGFSGHGFKFAPAIGEIIESSLFGKKENPPKLFDPKRFSA